MRPRKALFLANYVDHVTILVRGSHFRATQIIQDNVFANPKIDVRWHIDVQEFLGEHSSLNKAAPEEQSNRGRRILGGGRGFHIRRSHAEYAGFWRGAPFSLTNGVLS